MILIFLCQNRVLMVIMEIKFVLNAKNALIRMNCG
nr:MAG TPA: hypothetical protein [Caudoviricetes sp.]